jgi:D-alanyl-D-alanine dipeptidase
MGSNASRRLLSFLLVTLVLTGSAVCQTSPLSSTTQIVVVTTARWNSITGQAQLFERKKPDTSWKPEGSPFEIVVGKTGLAWGSGVLTPAYRASDPVKKEGDGKAPAGVFRLSKAFGYASQPAAGIMLDYVPLSPSIECVDDTASRYYNKIENRASVAPDWNSSEHMLRSDELYRWGIVVDHNADPPKAGGGSCIFMHIWRGPGQGTVGCTAMPQARIEALLGWIDPARQPLLIQMPRREYEAVRKRLKLPKLKRSAARH